MNQYQRAGQTNHLRAEKRKAEYREQLKRRELIKKSMTTVLSDPDASSSDKVTAAEILMKL